MRIGMAVMLALFLAACQSESRALAIPQMLEGGWRQASVTATAPSRQPEWMSRLGISKASTVRYDGSVEAEVDIYELRSSAAALECMQLWKRSPGESFLMKRNLFVVIRSTHPNREMVMDFSRALEKAL